MNSVQYEELCRYFLSVLLDVPVSEIKSVSIPNPSRPGLAEYRHQIDLYWEDGNELVSYINIANAKWRTNSKIEQGEVLLLNQVKQKVAAHKAMMLSNVGFTKGAQAVAQDEGIALHLVKPAFDYTLLPEKDREAIQRRIQEIAARSTYPIWEFVPYHKSFNGFAIAIPDRIRQALAIASDEDRFLVVQMVRHLEYLRDIKRRIEAGEYGERDTIAIYEQKIRKTQALINKKLSEIESQ